MTEAEERLRKYLKINSEKYISNEDDIYYCDYIVNNKLEKDIETVLNMIEEARKYIKIRGIQKVSMGTNYKGLDGLQIKTLLKILGE